MPKSEQSGPITSVSNEAVENKPAAVGRHRDLDFNRWEKEFLQLAFPVTVEVPVPEDAPEGTEPEVKLVAYDLFIHVPTNEIDAQERLLASFDEKAREQYKELPETFQKMMLKAFLSDLPKKSEFPTTGKLADLPLASMRIDAYGAWELISRDPTRGIDDHMAILAVKFHAQIHDRLQKHRRGVDVLASMLEAFGFYMATADTENETWTSVERRANDVLADELHAAKLPR